MFNSYNSHIVTRFHSNLVGQLVAGEITASVGVDKMLSFEINEAYTENRIHDAVTRADDYLPEYEHTYEDAKLYEPTHRTSLFDTFNPQSNPQTGA